jgi:hypothetical protein
MSDLAAATKFAFGFFANDFKLWSNVNGRSLTEGCIGPFVDVMSIEITGSCTFSLSTEG